MGKVVFTEVRFPEEHDLGLFGEGFGIFDEMMRDVVVDKGGKGAVLAGVVRKVAGLFEF